MTPSIGLACEKLSLSEAKPGQKKENRYTNNFLSISLKIYRHEYCLGGFYSYIERHIDPQFSLLRQHAFLPRRHVGQGCSLIRRFTFLATGACQPVA